MIFIYFAVLGTSIIDLAMNLFNKPNSPTLLRKQTEICLSFPNKTRKSKEELAGYNGTVVLLGDWGSIY